MCISGMRGSTQFGRPRRAAAEGIVIVNVRVTWLSASCAGCGRCSSFHTCRGLSNEAAPLCGTDDGSIDHGGRRDKNCSVPNLSAHRDLVTTLFLQVEAAVTRRTCHAMHFTCSASGREGSAVRRVAH